MPGGSCDNRFRHVSHKAACGCRGTRLFPVEDKEIEGENGGAYVGSPGHSPDKSEPTVIKPGLRLILTIQQQDGRTLIGTWSSPGKRSGW